MIREGSLSSLRDAVRRHGVRGLAHIAAVRVRRPVYWRETFIWYDLDLSGERDRPVRSLPDGYDLVRVGENEIELAASTGKKPNQVRAALADGHDLWLVRTGDEAAFSCWVYRQRAPEIAAQKGWFHLPEGVVCIEDSVTMPDHRGKGIAPAAWSAIATRIADEGLAAIVTRVAETNGASRHACQKVGFVEIGEMRFKRTGPSKSQRVLGASGDRGKLLALTLLR